MRTLILTWYVHLVINHILCFFKLYKIILVRSRIRELFYLPWCLRAAEIFIVQPTIIIRIIHYLISFFSSQISVALILYNGTYNLCHSQISLRSSSNYLSQCLQFLYLFILFFILHFKYISLCYSHLLL